MLGFLVRERKREMLESFERLTEMLVSFERERV